VTTCQRLIGSQKLPVSPLGLVETFQQPIVGFSINHLYMLASLVLHFEAQAAYVCSLARECSSRTQASGLSCLNSRMSIQILMAATVQSSSSITILMHQEDTDNLKFSE